MYYLTNPNAEKLIFFARFLCCLFMPLLQDLSRGFSHLLFPQLCAACQEPLMTSEDTICLSCYQELPRTGYHHYPDNEAALRFAGRIPYRHVTALAHFVEDGLLQYLLHQLKYKNRKHIGTFLGKQLGADLQQGNWVWEVDVILPIPLHPKKEAARGYNQAGLIAEGLGEVIHKKVDTNSLQRIKATQSQVKKSREERVANLKDAFIIRREDHLKNRHVLLIDDVLTTGATLESAALALLRLPGVQVSIATIGMATG